MKAVLFHASLVLTVAMVTVAQDSKILDELVTVKKIQRNMKRQLTADVEDLQKAVQTLEDNQKKDATQVQATVSQLEDKVNSMTASGSGAGGGSTYIRWGRKTCPDTASLVYEGVVGGKYYTHAGGASNALCLTRQPQYDNTTKPRYFGYVYGAEYEYIADVHDHDVPCSVCLASQANTIMVPATRTCPAGWTTQYSGYVVSGYHARYASEYLCLDGSPEGDEGGIANNNGFLLYLVLSRCGSLPCPPFENDKVVTCVVCSK